MPASEGPKHVLVQPHRGGRLLCLHCRATKQITPVQIAFTHLHIFTW
jgi:hypothetical protein